MSSSHDQGEPELPPPLSSPDSIEPRAPSTGLENLLRQSENESVTEANVTVASADPIEATVEERSGLGPEATQEENGARRFRGFRAFMTQMSASAESALQEVRDRSPRRMPGVGGFMNRFRRDRMVPLAPDHHLAEPGGEPTPPAEDTNAITTPNDSLSPSEPATAEQVETQAESPSAAGESNGLPPIPTPIPRRSLPRLKRPTTLAAPPPHPASNQPLTQTAAPRSPSPRRRRTLNNGDVLVDSSDVLAPDAVSAHNVVEPLSNLMHFRRGNHQRFQHLSVAYIESKTDGSFHRVPAKEFVKIGVDDDAERAKRQQLKGDGGPNLDEQRRQLVVLVFKAKHIAHGLLAGIALVFLLCQWRSMSVVGLLALYSPMSDVYHGVIHTCSVIALTGYLHDLERARTTTPSAAFILLSLLAVFTLNLVTSQLDQTIFHQYQTDQNWYSKAINESVFELWKRLNYARCALVLTSWVVAPHRELRRPERSKISMAVGS